MNIKRSHGLRPKINGVPIATCSLPGGGFNGKTRALDRAVERTAEMLRDHYKCDVEIRFNSHRESGGAYINGPDWTGAGINASQYEGKGRVRYACNVSERFLKDKTDVTDRSALTEGEGYAYKHFKTLAGAYNWFIAHASPPVDYK